MLVRFSIGTAVAVALAGCTCGTTHSFDAGVDAFRPPPPDARRDTALDTRFPLDFEGDAGCRRVHGFRVCGEECLAPCSGGDGRCSSLGICYGARGSDLGYGCGYAFQGGDYCGDGRICAPVAGSYLAEDPDDGARGTCIDADFCADLATAGLRSTQCQYSDGTLFVTGPPDVVGCPPSHPVFQFCGGPCLGVICPEEPGITLNRNCLGMSDNRGFGVCGRSNGLNCLQGEDFNHFLVDEHCPGMQGELGFPEEPCACLVPRPQAEGLPREIGWPVALSVCQRYRDLNPGFADCLDADWRSVP